MNDTKKFINKKSMILANILVIYIYTPYFFNISKNILNLSSIYNYAIYILLALVAIFVTMKINKKMIAFFIIFINLIIFNYIAVSYKHYVLVEGIQALIYMLVPSICISSDSFDLKKFVEKWLKFARCNLLLVILAVIFLKLRLVNYSIFTSICVPNIFIESYILLRENSKTKWSYINILFNIFIIAILGGRMAAAISVFMFLFAYLFSKKINIWKKIILVIVLIVLTYFLLNNLIEILYWLNQKLIQYNINSRSINLLIKQLESNEIYLTNRDYIYEVSWEYIKSKSGLPGGFGIPLYITSGKYYYTHNIILQFLTFFGSFGTIIIGGIIYIRYHLIKNIMSSNCKKFLLFLVICYIGIGLTGSSIWIHYLSTIFIATFFFGNSKLYNSI